MARKDSNGGFYILTFAGYASGNSTCQNTTGGCDIDLIWMRHAYDEFEVFNFE